MKNLNEIQLNEALDFIRTVIGNSDLEGIGNAEIFDIDYIDESDNCLGLSFTINEKMICLSNRSNTVVFSKNGIISLEFSFSFLHTNLLQAIEELKEKGYRVL